MIKQILGKIITEAESNKEQYVSNNNRLDKKVICILILVPFCLSMINYLGEYDFLRNNLLKIGATDIASKMDVIFNGSNNLGNLFYWVIILIFFYFVLPCLAIKFLFKEKLSDYGLKLKGAFKDYYIYIIMIIIMIPLLIYFSRTTAFQEKYPFLKIRTGDNLYPNFWKWELLYCLQFFALEFFFRGFIIFGLKPKFGIYSIFIMTIPYCMIHFGKPLPETIAAIIAGIILGFLSLKNKSIFLGVLAHISVGISMDLASLWQKGFFH